MKRISIVFLHIVLSLFLFTYAPVTADAQRVKKEQAKKMLEGETPQWFVEKAKSLIRKGKWASAKNVLDQAIDTYPEDPNARWLMGRYYEHIGDLNKARYNLLKCLQNEAGHVNAKHAMISVETKAKHYSNALAYCNELLEVVPYDKSLWRKKMELYRLMKNYKMADQILNRMQKIFPNDTTIMRDIYYQKEMSYINNMKQGSLVAATTQLEDLINAKPRNQQYYQDLINVYKRRGMFDKALSVCDAALAQFGSANPTFLKQKINMLCSQGRHQEALAYLSEVKRSSGYAAQLYQQVTDDALEINRIHDPYEGTAKLYEKNHNLEDLNYLLSTAVNKGFYDDAIYYIGEARKRGLKKDLLAMEYDVELRAGHTDRANHLLWQMYERNPHDPDLVEKVGRQKLREANDEFVQQDYTNAIEHLYEVIGMGFMSKEEINSAKFKILSSYLALKQYDKAKQYYRTLIQTDSPDMRNAFYSVYEEGMIKKIKGLAESEHYGEVLEEAEELLEFNPSSEDALRYAINASDALDRRSLFDHYADIGYNAYPNSPYFVIRKAISLNRNGKHDEAMEILHELLESNKTNTAIQKAFIESCTDYAHQLVKDNMGNEALKVCDMALEYAPKDRELNYIKGLAYEKLHMGKLAYQYQMKYTDVSLAELPEFRQHMRGLNYKSSKDHVDVDYTRVTSNNSGGDESPTSIKYVSSKASITYTHSDTINTYMGKFDYNGVEGDPHDPHGLARGGTGYQGTVQWEHTFNTKWSGYASASVSNKYFNKFGFNVSATRHFDDELTASVKAGYRRTPEIEERVLNDEGRAETVRNIYNLFLLTPSAEKWWQEKYVTSAQVDFSYMGKKFYYNISAKAKMFFNEDGVTSMTLSGGFGTFPEMSLFDLGAATAFGKNNTMVALDGQLLVAKNIALGINGTWYTNYSPTVIYHTMTSYYRNLFSINFQIHVAL